LSPQPVKRAPNVARNTVAAERVTGRMMYNRRDE
jgi:hypothetical protein